MTADSKQALSQIKNLNKIKTKLLWRQKFMRVFLMFFIIKIQSF